MDILVLKPFNLVFIGLLVLTAVFGILFIRQFRNKNEDTRKRAVMIMYIIVFVLFMLYKFFLSMDVSYSEYRMAHGSGPFNWFGELPLNLCNINIIIIVLGLLLNSRALLGFCFFSSFLGALGALVMPPIGFSGFSILLPRMLGYYITHLAVLLEMPILAGLNLYKPQKSDIGRVFAAFFVTSLVVFGINLLIIYTGLEPNCNYFYSMKPEGVAVLELLYSLIPVPWVYELPLAVVVIPYMLLLTYCINLKPSKKKAEKTETEPRN